MIEAIKVEFKLRKNYLIEDVNSIYFGGGTPSILKAKQIGSLIDHMANLWQINPDAEITMEANPEDISITKSKELIDIGVNRISLGVQTFDDDILRSLNRMHTRSSATRSVKILQDSGIGNISIDLIYGIPKQDYGTWTTNLEQASLLEIPHLSCYALTIEDKTAFGHWQRTGKLKPAAESKIAKDYKVMCNMLAHEGYEHYEVSNFAKPGYKSQHNSSYWQQEAYLGMGPGAHSYNKKSRQFNISNNATYIKALNRGNLPQEEENLTDTQLYNEYILTGLRTNTGIDLKEVKDVFGHDILNNNKRFIDKCLKKGMATLANNRFILTEDALLLADSVIIELMIDE
jgi:putative oxygen-independent coproporphyrinogen III oxidase